MPLERDMSQVQPRLGPTRSHRASHARRRALALGALAAVAAAVSVVTLRDPERFARALSGSSICAAAGPTTQASGDRRDTARQHRFGRHARHRCGECRRGFPSPAAQPSCSAASTRPTQPWTRYRASTARRQPPPPPPCRQRSAAPERSSSPVRPICSAAPATGGPTTDIVSIAQGGTPTIVASLPQPTSNAAVARVGGTAYVIGGSNGTTDLSTIVAYTPNVGSRTVASLPEPTEGSRGRGAWRQRLRGRGGQRQHDAEHDLSLRSHQRERDADRLAAAAADQRGGGPSATGRSSSSAARERLPGIKRLRSLASRRRATPSPCSEHSRSSSTTRLR